MTCINSCSTLKFTTTWAKQPKQEYYSLSKENNTQIGRLDTNLIYVNGQDWVLTGDFGSRKKYQYDFIKFGKNGIAYYSNYSDYPFTEASILSIGGQYCYYKVRNDELQFEFYDHLAKKFKIWYAKIYLDKIQFYEYRLQVFGGAKGKINFVYYKQLIKYPGTLVWPQ